MKIVKYPCFLHNLKNYDAHLIIDNAHKFNSKSRINVIAQNSEKFITFSFDHIIFKDSMSFLASSLDKLVNLNKYKEIGDNKFELISNWKDNFKYSYNNKYVNNDDDLNLLTEKGIYPYDYTNNWKKFEDEKLPPKEKFYSELKEEEISDTDYEKAQKVWNNFNIKNLGEYHDLYLMTDVLLLTDVFEKFRNMCLDYYNLDPAHYYTLPNFAWDVMLLKCDHEFKKENKNFAFELIHDLEMYEMIESGLRGGMCQVSHKHIEANNKYMDNYDDTKPSTYINYLDANNLYGLAMTENYH